MKAGGGHVMTIGEIALHFLTKLEWYSTLFPRIPVPIQKQIEQNLLARKATRAVAAARLGSTAPEHSSRAASYSDLERIGRQDERIPVRENRFPDDNIDRSHYHGDDSRPDIPRRSPSNRDYRRSPAPRSPDRKDSSRRRSRSADRSSRHRSRSRDRHGHKLPRDHNDGSRQSRNRSGSRKRSVERERQRSRSASEKRHSSSRHRSTERDHHRSRSDKMSSSRHGSSRSHHRSRSHERLGSHGHRDGSRTLEDRKDRRSPKDNDPFERDLQKELERVKKLKAGGSRQNGE